MTRATRSICLSGARILEENPTDLGNSSKNTRVFIVISLSEFISFEGVEI